MEHSEHPITCDKNVPGILQIGSLINLRFFFYFFILMSSYSISTGIHAVTLVKIYTKKIEIFKTQNGVFKFEAIYNLFCRVDGKFMTPNRCSMGIFKATLMTYFIKFIYCYSRNILF